MQTIIIKLDLHVINFDDIKNKCILNNITIKPSGFHNCIKIGVKHKNIHNSCLICKDKIIIRNIKECENIQLIIDYLNEIFDLKCSHYDIVMTES